MSIPSDRPSEAAGDAPSGTPGVAATDAIGDSRGDTYVARVARGAGISTVGQGAGRVLGYLAQVMIARLFGPAAFGFYSLGVAAVNGAQILSRFGMENGVVRYVAHHRAREDTARVRGTVIQAIGVTLVISLVLSAVMFFGAGLAADWYYHKPFMETVLRAFAVTLPFFTFMMMILWATQGFQTVTYASYVQQMIRPALFLLLVPSFYARGELEDLGRLYKDVSRWIFTGAFALFLPIVLLSQQILAIFGPGFTAGWTALIIVSAAQLYSSSVGPTPRMLAMTGNQNVAMLT